VEVIVDLASARDKRKERDTLLAINVARRTARAKQLAGIRSQDPGSYPGGAGVRSPVMTISLALHVLGALAAVSAAGDSGAHPRHLAPRIDSDSTAIMAVASELRSYYRDLHDRNWPSIVTHFYPAKVTARYAVPDDSTAWRALAAPPAEPRAVPDAHGYCAPASNIVVIGHWARVRARRCSGELDEAWFYSMSGRWKMIHLVSGAPLTT
jgi:hypothetical protein